MSYNITYRQCKIYKFQSRGLLPYLLPSFIYKFDVNKLELFVIVVYNYNDNLNNYTVVI